MLTWMSFLSALPVWIALGIKMTVLLAAASVVHVALTGRNPRWRVLLWRGTMVGILLLPLTALMLPGFTVPVPEAPLPIVQSAPITPSVNVMPQEVASSEAPTIPEGHTPIGMTSATPTLSPSLSAQCLSWLKGHFLTILAGIWALVSTFLLLRILIGAQQVRRLIDVTRPAPETLRNLLIQIAGTLGCPTTVELRTTSRMKSPFLAGLFRPVVVIPETITADTFADDVPAILAHELSHLKTHDLVWLSLAKILSALFWFHPLAWGLRAAHAAACESVCDAVAADYVGGAPHYTKTLARVALQMAESSPACYGVPMLRSAEITRRIRKISHGLKAASLSRRGVTVTVVIGLVALFALGGVRLVRADQEPGMVEIGGIVVDEAGKPITDATVLVLERDPIIHRTFQIQDSFVKSRLKGKTKSTTDGRFSLTLPETGINGGREITVTHPNYGFSFYSPELTIEGAQERKYLSNCQIVMPKRGFIQGKVLNTANKPIENAKLTVIVLNKTGDSQAWISSRDNPLLTTMTSTDGVFKLDGLPQDACVSLRASHPDYACNVIGLIASRDSNTGAIPVNSTDTIIMLQPGGTIKGKIAWDGTEKPVAHMPVGAWALYKDNKTAIDSFVLPDFTETDDNGFFAITGLPLGKYVLKAGPCKEGVILPKMVEVVQFVEMSGQDLTATKGVRISAKFVKAGTNKLFEGGNIIACPNNAPDDLTVFETTPNGKLEGCMAPGDVTLRASLPKGSLSLTERQKTLTLVAGQGQADLVFEVNPALFFKGQILDIDSKPVPFAIVTPGLGKKPIISDQKGHFEYELPFWKSLHEHNAVFLKAYRPDNPNLRGIIGKTIESEYDLEGNIVLTPVGVIRGKVVDKDGRPISTARVEAIVLTEAQEIIDREVGCDAAGLFEIKDAVGGMKYSISATATEIFGQAKATQTLVKPGATWDVGSLVLPAADKVIVGTVKDEEGKPLKGVRLNTFGGGTGIRQAWSREKGLFRFENIVDEQVEINAWYDSPKGMRHADAIAKGGDTNIEMTLKAQSSKAESVTPQTEATPSTPAVSTPTAIGGIVVDEAGKPITDATVLVLEPPQLITGTFSIRSVEAYCLIKNEVKSGADGRFTVTMTQSGIDRGGSIAATHPEYGFFVVDTKKLTEEGKKLTNRQIVMPRRGFIQGKAVDTSNNPVKDATVDVIILRSAKGSPWFLPNAEKLHLRTKTNAEGIFKLDGLPQGATVSIRASHPKYECRVIGMLIDKANLTLTIPVNSTDTLITFKPGATIEGRILWEGTETPVAHVPVGAWAYSKDNIPSIESFGLPDFTETDDKGFFRITGVPPGRCILKAGPYEEGVILPKTVIVEPSAQITGQVLTAAKGVNISAKIIKPSTNELIKEEVSIQARDNATGDMTLFETKPDGMMVGRMAPGNVTLHAYLHGMPEGYTAPGDLYLPDAQQYLTLVAGQDQTDVVFHACTPIFFKGRVLDPEGKPVAQAKVMLNIGGTVYLSNQEGYFDYPLPSGFSLRKHRVLFLEVLHPTKSNMRGKIGKTIEEEKDLKGDIVLTPVGTIRGKVVGTEGKPVPSAKISAIVETEAHGIIDREVNGDALGQFEIKDAVGNMKYSIIASATNKYGETKTTQKVVEPGTTWEVGTLALPAADMALEGRVKDEEGKPIADVHLYCIGENMGRREAYGDAAGHFRLENIVADAVTITACAGNYLSTEVSAKGGDTNIEMTLKAQSSKAESVTPQTEATPSSPAVSAANNVAGIVVDEGGKPVADATVAIRSQDLKVSFKKEVKSGADGRFTLTLTEAGINLEEMVITATHPNYGIYSNYCCNIPQEGMDISDCRIVMIKRGYIQGTVVDTADKPVMDAVIMVQRSKKILQNMQPSIIQLPYDSTLSVKTAADGTFKLDGLPQDETLIVTASHPDFVTGFAGVPASRHEYLGTIVVGSTDIHIKLQPGATIEGKVSFEGTGTPVGHVFVGAFPKDFYSPLSMIVPCQAETDDNGVFVIKSVAPGKCILKETHNLDGIILPKTVEVSQGSKLTGQDLTVTKGVRIAGKFIKGSTKGPVGGGCVFASSQTGEYLASFKVKPDGTFEGHMLPGYVTIQARIPNASLTTSKKQLTLVAGQDQTDLVFEVNPQLVFRGRVLGVDGNPIAGAIVFSKLGGVGKPARSDQNGRFDYPLSSEINLKEMDGYIFEARHPDKPGLRGILDKRSKNEKDLTGDIVMGPTGTIRGKIVDVNGKPVPTAEIATFIALKNATMNDLNADCDQEGRFEIKEAIPDKSYNLLAMADNIGRVESNTFSMPPGATWDVGTLILTEAGNAPAGTASTVNTPPAVPCAPENRGPSLLVHPDSTPGSFSGSVSDKNGKPIEGVLVDAFHWCPGNNTKTDAQGQFKLDGFDKKTDNIEVRFTKDGYAPMVFAFQPLGVLNQPLIMDDKTCFEGRVTLPDGTPSANILVRADQGPKNGPGVLITEIWTETRSGSDGRYRLLVQDDTYDIQVRDDKGNASRFSNVTIAKGEVKAFDIALKPGIVFRAKVLDSQTGKPLPGIRLLNWQQPGVEGRSDSQGQIEITGMVPGKFQFDVDAPGYTRWWSEQCINEWSRLSINPETNWQSNFDSLDFDLKEGMKIVTITLEQGVRVRGRVLDPDGQPVAGATVAPAHTGTGNSLTGDTRFSVESTADGTFEMSLPASKKIKYNLVVHDGKYEEWRKWANGVGEPFQTQPGDQLNDVTLRLTRPGIVKGKVVDQAGQPVANREVRSSAKDTLENRYYDPTTTTSKEGLFELRFVRAGEQYIQVAPFWLQGSEAPSGTSQVVTVEVGKTIEGVSLVTAPKN